MIARCLFILSLLLLCACDTATKAVRTLDPDAIERGGNTPPPRFAGLMREPRPTLQIGLVRQGLQSRLIQESIDGPYVRYLSIDRAAIVLQDGLLHSVFGFGDGLMGSDFAQTLAKLRTGSEGQVTRRHTYLTGEDTTRVRVFNCDVTFEGASEVDLATGPVATRLYHERCQGLGAEISFENQYWYDPKTGQVIQSLQWVGETFGALSTRVLPQP